MHFHLLNTTQTVFHFYYENSKTNNTKTNQICTIKFTNCSKRRKKQTYHYSRILLLLYTDSLIIINRSFDFPLFYTIVIIQPTRFLCSSNKGKNFGHRDAATFQRQKTFSSGCTRPTVIDTTNWLGRLLRSTKHSTKSRGDSQKQEVQNTLRSSQTLLDIGASQRMTGDVPQCKLGCQTNVFCKKNFFLNLSKKKVFGSCFLPIC